MKSLERVSEKGRWSISKWQQVRDSCQQNVCQNYNSTKSIWKLVHEDCWRTRCYPTWLFSATQRQIIHNSTARIQALESAKGNFVNIENILRYNPIVAHFLQSHVLSSGNNMTSIHVHLSSGTTKPVNLLYLYFWLIIVE